MILDFSFSTIVTRMVADVLNNILTSNSLGGRFDVALMLFVLTVLVSYFGTKVVHYTRILNADDPGWVHYVMNMERITRYLTGFVLAQYVTSLAGQLLLSFSFGNVEFWLLLGGVLLGLFAVSVFTDDFVAADLNDLNHASRRDA